MRYTDAHLRVMPLFTMLVFSSFLLLGSSAAKAARLLMVGDSITHGVEDQCGYRAVLAAELLGRNSCDITFTGTNWEPSGVPPVRPPPAYCEPGEFAHESQSGWTVDNFLPPTPFQLAPNWVQLASPDFILIHLGTNDYYNGDSVATVLLELDALMTHVLAERPDTKILLANVIPLSATDPSSIQYGNDLAAAIKDLVDIRAEDGDAVYLVDVHSGFDVAAMSFDTVHPNDLGEQFLSDRFVSVLDSLNVCSTPSIRITLPEQGSTLAGSSTRVEWTVEGVLADAFRVTVGSRGAYRAVLEPTIEDNPPPSGHVQPGIADYDPGTVLPASANSTTVSGLPTDGRRAFITLHYRENGIWKLSPLSVTTSNEECDMLDPVNRFVMENDEWFTLSLPCEPPVGTTVSQLFGDDIPGSYGTTWAVLTYDPAADPSDPYTQLAASDSVSADEGFWIKQITGSVVTLTLPVGSTRVPTDFEAGAACNSAIGCRSFALSGLTPNAGSPNGPPVRWQLGGNPFTDSSVPMDMIRVTTASGACSVVDGCTLNEATAADVAANVFFHYSGSDGYQVLSPNSGSATLDPWQGFWVGGLTNAVGNDPKVVINR